MVPASTHLTVTEYDRVYGHESGWEYWFGEARRKPVPTHLHGLLQILLAELLRFAGYISSVETELRTVSEWRPRPDVCGLLEEVEGRYPTKPVEVAFEVLSEDEDILTKCHHYSQIGIPQIFAFEPEAGTILRWDGEKLTPVVNVELANGVTITGATVWSQLERRRHREPPKSITI